MNICWSSPEDNFRGDWWSRDWCSDTEIPLFLDLTAPQNVKIDLHLRGFVIWTCKTKTSRKSQFFSESLRIKFLSFHFLLRNWQRPKRLNEHNVWKRGSRKGRRWAWERWRSYHSCPVQDLWKRVNRLGGLDHGRQSHRLRWKRWPRLCTPGSCP